MTKLKITRICSVENCEKKELGRGWCSAHYARWRTYGDPLGKAEPKPQRLCSIEGCERIHEGLGYCKLHRERLRTHGDPLYERQMRLCSIEGCLNEHSGKGYCQKHALRLKFYGDPLALHPTRGRGDTVEERFWSKVDKTPGLGRDGDCWEWRGGIGRSDAPYGLFTIEYKQWRTHRLSYFWATGREPVLDVLHRCDNPRCVNPEHLWEGTTQENTADRQQKQRHAHGESHGCAKLSEKDVMRIRRMRQEGSSYQEIKQTFDISQSHAEGIIKGERWKHIPLENAPNSSKSRSVPTLNCTVRE